MGHNVQAAPAPSAAAVPDASASTTASTFVDVVAQLDRRAAAHAEKLKWKTSIAGLLKPLGTESSLAARKDLATELGCPPEKRVDSVRTNVWPHQTVLRKLAENGGHVPKQLLG